jgi:integrase
MSRYKYGSWDDPQNAYRDLVPYADDFLETLSKTSRQRYFNKIVDVALFLKERYNRDLLKASGTELKRYFKEKVDSRQIKKSTKKLYKNYISGYYEAVKRIKKDLENDPHFINPVPSTTTIAFTGIDKPLEIIQTREYLTVEDAKHILEHIYFTKEQEALFYASALLILSGARVSEVCHLKPERVNADDRWFITTVKSPKDNKRDGIYFFPEFFRAPFIRYIKRVYEEEGTPKWIFPSRVEGVHLSPRYIQNSFKEASEVLGIKAKSNPHSFRDFINTKRYEKGIRKEDLKFLLNHAQNETYASNYLKNRENRLILRNLYDKSCPFTKDLLPALVYNKNPIY